MLHLSPGHEGLLLELVETLLAMGVVGWMKEGLVVCPRHLLPALVVMKVLPIVLGVLDEWRAGLAPPQIRMKERRRRLVSL